ncbi:hypothetical protein K7711_01495 [Nocardia sp. CA2R105]|uniref:hypothetical protein n=1 Tax=Nocardia coffeae TaxID=2873381 RepID=UPI001CA7731F|nr:hypothetical protein [Nocardia coffeae]MBY8855143.1 hypothetical protein [Nocardia coffeae]
MHHTTLPSGKQMWSEPPPPIGAAWCDVAGAAGIVAAEAAGAAKTARGNASAVTAIILIFLSNMCPTLQENSIRVMTVYCNRHLDFSSDGVPASAPQLPELPPSP